MYPFHFFLKLTESSENDDPEKSSSKSVKTNMLSPEGQTTDYWPFFLDQGFYTLVAFSLSNQSLHTFMMVPLLRPLLAFSSTSMPLTKNQLVGAAMIATCQRNCPSKLILVPIFTCNKLQTTRKVSYRPRSDPLWCKNPHFIRKITF